MDDADLGAHVTAARSKKFAALRDLLRYIRKEKLPRADLVVEHGAVLLQSANKLGDERWTVYEQVLKAALEQSDLRLADECLGPLKGKFRDSHRVRLLQGSLLEALGNYEKAEAIYGHILEANPANTLAMKRKVAVLRAQGQLAAASKELNRYLASFGADAEAWQELADLYMAMADYESAAYCYEELVLATPASPHVHCRLAELYYTLGGAANTLAARKHFSQSLELRPGNPRAQHGLCLACGALASAKGAKELRDGGGAVVNSALHEFAADQLRAAYKATGNKALLSAVENVLAEQESWQQDR